MKTSLLALGLQVTLGSHRQQHEFVPSEKDAATVHLCLLDSLPVLRPGALS